MSTNLELVSSFRTLFKNYFVIYSNGKVLTGFIMVPTGRLWVRRGPCYNDDFCKQALEKYSKRSAKKEMPADLRPLADTVAIQSFKWFLFKEFMKAPIEQFA